MNLCDRILVLYRVAEWLFKVEILKGNKMKNVFGEFSQAPVFDRFVIISLSTFSMKSLLSIDKSFLLCW